MKKKASHNKMMETPIRRRGMIEFEDYHSKLKMMDTALFLFGMKLYRQHGSTQFLDADFCNSLVVRSTDFFDKELGYACNIINEILINCGFSGNCLQVGKLKDINDFNL